MTTSQLPTAEAVASSLAPLKTGLNADGYDLELMAIDDKIRLRVVALENACEECLVPKDVMTRILASRIETPVDPGDIDITYPVDH